MLVQKLLEQRKERRRVGPYLVTTPDIRRLTSSMLRIRLEETGIDAAATALERLDEMLTAAIHSFQFRDIRPKAASEIEDPGRASNSPATPTRVTETVYRCVGEVVDPTR